MNDSPAMARRYQTSRGVQRPLRAPSPTVPSADIGSLIRDRSCQPELLRERGKMAFDLGLADGGQRGGSPARGIVLVEDHGTDSFIEIVTVDDARNDAELGAHALAERPVRTAAHLRQRNLQARRRLPANRRC